MLYYSYYILDTDFGYRGRSVFDGGNTTFWSGGIAFWSTPTDFWTCDTEKRAGVPAFWACDTGKWVADHKNRYYKVFFETFLGVRGGVFDARDKF